jgi:hypothetical protein
LWFREFEVEVLLVVVETRDKLSGKAQIIAGEEFEAVGVMLKSERRVGIILL